MGVCGYGIAWGDSGPVFQIYVKYNSSSSWTQVYSATNRMHRSGNANPSTYWGCWANPSPNTNIYQVMVRMSDGSSDSCVNGMIIKG